MFAVVAVNAPVHGSGTAYRRTPATTVDAGEVHTFPGPVFHYHIPPELDRQLSPGVLVEVPFGPRQVQGLVMALSEMSPVSETKPVTRALSDDPVLTRHQLDLGMWLSEYYLSPLIDCLRLMLPPGMLRRPRTVVRIHPEVPIPEGLSPSEKQAIELVRRYGTLSPTQIARRLGKGKASLAIRALVRRGILIRGSDLPTPRARPRRANFIRLNASPPQVAAARHLLGHPSKQAQVLQALLDAEDPLPSPHHVLALADASPSTLSTLASKGWIELVPDRSLILLLPTAESADLGRAPKQQAVLEYLREQSDPVEEHALRQAVGVSASVLRSLHRRGLIQSVAEPAAAILRLDDREARQKITELRGAARQHRVLDYLLSRPPGEWIWVSWVYAETDCKLGDLRALEGHGLIDLVEREVWRDPLGEETFVLETPPRLTPDQERVWIEIEPYVSQRSSTPGNPIAFLLHGVTGSGKTEIYMRAVEATLRQGRQALVLVPEISLTPQTIRRFAARFPDGLGVIHSGLSDGERYDTWRRIRAEQIQLLIGPRSALFTPLENVGLIVADEEHDASYKQSDLMPSYHARAVALRISLMQDAIVLLGSATPDLVTFYHARETGDIRLLELPQRILKHRRHLLRQREQQAQLRLSQARYRPLGPDYKDVYAADLPPVQVVDMRHELRAGNRSIFSRVLQREMKRALNDREQIILFLNRRGASTFVMCRDCGTAIRCPRCDVPLTFHLKSERLTCHHCNHQQPVPDNCPICQSRRIRHFGVGTQRVETAVNELLPTARVLRWDRDTTREKASHQALLDRFVHHQADVLVGTQMVAKGLDLPLVTLVGVVSADTALNLPDFRAAERTYQLLAQVAGRAGRGSHGGQVIVQTYTPDHYAIQSAARHDYAGFYARERAFRHQMDYPPFARFARLVYGDPDLARCREQAQALASSLAKDIRRHQLDRISLVGPAPCFLSRLRGRWRWQIIVRASSPVRITLDRPREDDLHRLLSSFPLPPGWRLDIDPLDVL